MIGKAITKPLMGYFVAGSLAFSATVSGIAYLKGRSDGKAITVGKVESQRNQQLIGALSETRRFYAEAAADRIKANLRNWKLAQENAQKKERVVVKWRTRKAKVENNAAPILDQIIPSDVMLEINCLRDPAYARTCHSGIAPAGGDNLGQSVDPQAGDANARRGE